MKKTTTFVALATMAFAGAAMADTYSNDIDTSWANADTGEIINHVFALPVLASVDSIKLEISHSWGNDLLITVTAPSGDVYDLMNGEVDQGGSGNFDMGLVPADITLANVAEYNFVASGGLTVWDDTSGVAPGGTYDANLWGAGNEIAGNWTLSVSDLVGGDGGSVGNFMVNYTVPAPGALALLGLAGLAGRRRRA